MLPMKSRGHVCSLAPSSRWPLFMSHIESNDPELSLFSGRLLSPSSHVSTVVVGECPDIAKEDSHVSRE